MSFKCPVEDCDKEFPTERGLNYHIARVHGYYCWICKQLFSSKIQLSNHMRGTHNRGEKDDI